MRFVVYGAGAIGGVVGGRLALAGYDVDLVARGRNLAKLRERGLQLESAEAVHTIPLATAESIAGFDLDEDTCVLVAVKSQDTAAVLSDLVEHLPAGATVACVQNGVANEVAALRHFAHVLGVCTLLPASHLEPGVVVENSAPVPGILDVGRFPDGIDDRTAALVKAFCDAGFISEERNNIMAWKYRKLISNLVNAVQAAYRPGDERDRLGELVRAEGERVIEVAGLPCVTDQQDAERRGEVLSREPVGERGGGSTWQSLARGTPTVETDYLNGEIILLGRLHHVPTPVNDVVYAAMSGLARQHGEPSTLSAGDALVSLGGSA